MAKARTVRIVLDTNWYISASINRSSRRTLYSLIINPSNELIYSTELLNEYRAVMARKKFRKVISESQVLRFLSLILPNLKQIEIKSNVPSSRDKNDNFLLALSVDSDADYLVIGDEDLLVLRTIGRTKIVTLSEFLALKIK